MENNMTELLHLFMDKDEIQICVLTYTTSSILWQKSEIEIKHEKYQELIAHKIFNSVW